MAFASLSVTAPAPGSSACSEIDLNRDLSSGFSGQYIRRKARQLVGKAGFTTSDREDIEQELTLVIIARRPDFNPQRGDWQAFVVTVVNHSIASLLRSRRRRKRRWYAKPLSAICTTPEEDATVWCCWVEPRHLAALTGQNGRDPLDQVELCADIDSILNTLPSHLKYVCNWLRQGSVAELAVRLRLSRTSIYNRLRTVRWAFERAGFSQKSDGL